jgi:hypothetical protein
VVFIINWLPPTTSPHISPFTILFNKNPDYTFFRVLGCLFYPLIRPYNSHKLQIHSLPCVFLGYCQHQKEYKCLHIQTNKIYISRHVRLDENTFPFTITSPLSSQSTTDLPLSTSLPLLQSSFPESDFSNQPTITTSL